jgi:hypothetical protein
MKIYILNHYVGGVPFDGHTIGVYKRLISLTHLGM